MNVRLFAVLGFLLTHAVIMAVRHGVVVVRMGVPVGAVLPFVERVARMVVRNVVVVMRVRLRLMGVLGLFSFTLSSLHCSC